ncbi:hypothetical protein AH06_249 [Erwinia phage AH06]|nr:hypothetical protein AH06_249 [Erwinia phage AH06]
MALSKTKIKRRTNAYHNYKTLVAGISRKCVMLQIDITKLKIRLNASKATLKEGEYIPAISERQGLKRELRRLRGVQGRRRIVNAGKIKAAISQY